MIVEIDLLKIAALCQEISDAAKKFPTEERRFWDGYAACAHVLARACEHEVNPCGLGGAEKQLQDQVDYLLSKQGT